MLLLVLGKCLCGCVLVEFPTQYHPDSLSPRNGSCSPFNRDGALCGQCREDHGPPSYSFSLKCVPCQNVSLWSTVPLYILVAYGPMTVFLAVVVAFTVSTNSAPLRGCILVLSSNIIMRVLMSIEVASPVLDVLSPYVQIFGTVYGVWNLDFFCSLYTSFCLHPSLTTLHVMALDYAITAYPLLLIVVMYTIQQRTWWR